MANVYKGLLLSTILTRIGLVDTPEHKWKSALSFYFSA